MAASGTKVDVMIEEPGVDGFGREWFPFMLRARTKLSVTNEEGEGMIRE
jgi:hypothetical protein